MRTSKLAATFAGTVTIAGCATLDKKTILLDVGDSKERVIEVMGTPQDRQVSGQREAWQYCKSGSGFGWNDHKVIWLSNGRVTGITSYKSSATGCRGGIQQVRWESAPDSVLEIRQR